jgi:5-(carboxyamino)imidazole ribonucleotide mutase
MSNLSNAPRVGIVMGSISDWSTLEKAAKILEQFQIPYEKEIVSAHRTPHKLYSYGEQAESRGIQVIIAGAGGAAHLPGMLSAVTHIPVLGVPVKSKTLNGVDSLLSIVQMPAGIPVPTLAIGEAGAINSALSAAAILSLSDSEIRMHLLAFREKQTNTVLHTNFPE